MSTSVDVYALPKLPSTTSRGPTRTCVCMLVLLLVIVLVELAPSFVVSFGGGDGVSVVVPTAVMGEAPLPLTLPLTPPLTLPPAAAQRFARVRATFKATGATDNDRQEFLNALDNYWIETRVQTDPQLQLIADMARTLGWLVERAQAQR